jgi:outer membrane protein assembly factor BamB
MKKYQLDEQKMGRLVARARTTPALSEGTKAKILEGFDSLEREKTRGKNPLQYIRYNPLYSLIIIIPFFLIFIIWGSYRIFLGPHEYYSPLVFSSGKAYRIDEPETPLAPGDTLGENDSVRVTTDDVCDLKLDNSPVFRFFPGSRFTIIGKPQSSHRLTIRLDEGNLYINRDSAVTRQKQVTITSGNYRFVLEGTRVLFNILDERLKVSCFEGRVRIISEEDMRRELFLLLAGEKIEIGLDGEKRHYRIDPLTRDEQRIDEAFIGFPAFDRDLVASVYPEQEESFHHEEESRTIAGEGEHRIKEKEEPGASSEPDKPTYMITEKWDIGDESYGSDNRIHFFAAIGDSRKTYVVSEKTLFAVTDGHIEPVLKLKDREYFKIRPVIAGKYLCAISTKRICLIERDRLAVESSIPLEKDGIVDENYYPAAKGAVLYIPVSNYGYYTLDTASPKPSLEIFYTEIFPVSPVIGDEGLFVGSFYNNYIALLDAKGNTRWKYTPEGSSYSNITLVDNTLYAYVMKNKGSFIVAIGKNGKKESEWPLDGRMVADLLSYNRSLFGFYTDGRLFRLDVAATRPETVTLVFTNTLSSRTWRNVCPLVHDGCLYIGTDNGDLVVYDIGDRATEDKIKVANGTAFYTPPFLCEEGICLVSNRGKIYSIVKTDR